MELHTEKIEEIIKSELYQFMMGKKYFLYSWVELSLIFVRDEYLITSAAIPFSNASPSIRTEILH